MGSTEGGVKLENGETGVVFNIQRYQIHDGPGIRTLVLLKGCPLRCLWCANPEGQNAAPQLYFLDVRCKACGICVKLCSHQANTIVEGHTVINRVLCTACGECVEACPYSAREIKGRTMTVEEVVKEVEKDRSFYFISGGGITISGGEPLAQATFTKNILRICKSMGIHTAIETSGCGSWNELEDIAKSTDWIFFDLKTVDEADHIRNTGLSTKQILSNASKLSQVLERQDTHLTVRIPVVPGYNNSERSITAIAEFVKAHMKAADEIELLRYHSLAVGKYEHLGMEYQLEDVIPSPESKMISLKRLIERCGVACRYEGEASEIYVGVK